MAPGKVFRGTRFLHDLKDGASTRPKSGETHRPKGRCFSPAARGRRHSSPFQGARSQKDSPGWRLRVKCPAFPWF